MSRYTVVYRDEGVFVDRDARWFKVGVLKERDSLGIALGVMDAPGWAKELPGGGDGPAIFSNAAVQLLANCIEEAIEAGQFRDKWQIEAAEFPLNAREARGLVNDGTADPRYFEAGAVVAFFEQ